MAQSPIVEPFVTGEERGPSLLDQETGEAVVLDAFLADVAANQERSDPPAT
jgi:hypothetical protein